MQANEHPPPWHSLSASEMLTRLDTLDLAEWERIFVFGLIVYSVVETEKAVIRRNHKPAIH